MFKYYIYGYKILSNIQLYNVEKYVEQNYTKIIDMDITLENLSTTEYWNISINRNNNHIVFKMGDNITYIMDLINDKFLITSRNLNVLESTLLNLPFALYAEADGALLLHASALFDDKNNRIIPFCAPKGMGKTTTTVALSKYFTFFSDDTILLRCSHDGIKGYYGNKNSKLTKDSIRLLEIKEGINEGKINIQGKYYYRPKHVAEENSNGLLLNNLYFLYRQETENITISKISKGFLTKILLHTNICGTSSLGYDYCKLVEKNDVFNRTLNECSFIKVVIPKFNKDFKKTIKQLYEYVVKEGAAI